jgi:hypothetical protein
MKSHLSEFERFYDVCCSYLNDNISDTFHECDCGIPGEYIKIRDNVTEKGFIPNRKKNRSKFRKQKSRTFKHINDSIYSVYDEKPDITIAKESDDVTKQNSFLHKKKANVRVSTRLQKFSKPPEVSTDFYFENYDIFKNFENFELSKHLIVEGCYDTNRHTIQLQSDCKNFNNSVLPNDDSLRHLKTAIRDSIRKLKIEELGEVCISDIEEYDFNMSTMPGYRFEHYLGASKKKDCVNEAVAVAKKRYSRIVDATKKGEIIKRKNIIPGIYSIGARNNRKVDPENDDNAVSRAVHMPEWHTELHSGMFSDRITAHLIDKGVGPIFIGNSFTKFDRLEKLINDNHSAVEGDWSKFDSSLCNVLITSAVCIARLYFPRGLLYDNHFLALLDTLVIKDYHIVGGRILRLLHGIPSGSKWTSVIGSFINLIVLNHSFSSVKYKDRSFAIGGDDFVTFIKTDKYNIDKLKEEVINKSENIGMNLKFFLIKKYKNSSNVDDYPVFYKYTVFNGVPITPISSILERVFSPWNKKYTSNSEMLSFLDNIMPSLAFPTTSCLIFYKFYKYVYFRATGQSLSITSIANRHFIIYQKMIDSSFFFTKKDVFCEINKRNVIITSTKLSKYVKTIFCI